MGRAQFFTLILCRRADPIMVTNAGARFTAQAKRLIAQAKPGDLYYFDNIRVRCPGDKASRRVNTMVFSIK